MVVEASQDVTYVIADINNRVRTLESKYSLFGERLLIVNQNMIEEYKKLMKELKAINADIQEMKVEIAEAKSVIKNLITELDLFAKKEKVQVLEKYLDLWNPLNFVTEDELDKAIEEKLVQARPRKEQNAAVS